MPEAGNYLPEGHLKCLNPGKKVNAQSYLNLGE
jgi:hypothetical protein